MKEPSGAIAGCDSEYLPENDAVRGSDQAPFARSDSMITLDPPGVVRVKNMVSPRGVNVGEPALAMPEISPGANIVGAERFAWAEAVEMTARAPSTPSRITPLRRAADSDVAGRPSLSTSS